MQFYRDHILQESMKGYFIQDADKLGILSLCHFKIVFVHYALKYHGFARSFLSSVTRSATFTCVFNDYTVYEHHVQKNQGHIQEVRGKVKVMTLKNLRQSFLRILKR